MSPAECANPFTSGYAEAIERDGFAVVAQCLNAEQVRRLIAAVESAIAAADETDTAVRDGGGVFAIRNLLDAVPALADVPRLPEVRKLVEPLLGARAFLVKSLLFDKTAESNWGVFWHQDLAIAVCERIETAGFHAWTRKAGVVHVQPPVSVLERMLTVRLSLDDCFEDKGPLKVLPGSHRHARLSDAETLDWQTTREAAVCTVPAGGAVVMRPLLLHSSSKATAASRRRVLHLEFAADDLPFPLEWHRRDA